MRIDSMATPIMHEKARAVGAAAVLLAVLISTPAYAQETAPAYFPTPEAAAAALIAAIERGDGRETEALLGKAFADLIEIQGGEARTRDRQRFLEAARRATVIRPDGPDRAVLEIGLQAWPMPAPLVREEQGWRFDGDEGVEVVTDRVIGRNELRAIDVLRAYVEAQIDYASEDRDGDQVLEYAQRIASTPGQRDGLYWAVAPGDEPSPLGPFLAEAGVTPETREAGTPYYGYHFAILTRQGPNVPGGAYDYVINDNMIAGFAMVAWPADYGESGIMTFMVNQRGVVVEKDMGPTTSELGPRIETYNPDASWTPVAED
jgi:hypothetical protein